MGPDYGPHSVSSLGSQRKPLIQFFFNTSPLLYTQATSSLVSGIKAEAETQDDSDSQKRLLGAAKLLADATAKLVEAAKVCVRRSKGEQSHVLACVLKEIA